MARTYLKEQRDAIREAVHVDAVLDCLPAQRHTSLHDERVALEGRGLLADGRDVLFLGLKKRKYIIKQ